MKFDITADISHVKLRCINCNQGENITPEEYQEYMAVLQNGKGIMVNHNFLVDTVCENCGCNTVNVTAKIDLIFR